MNYECYPYFPLLKTKEKRKKRKKSGVNHKAQSDTASIPYYDSCCPNEV